MASTSKHLPHCSVFYLKRDRCHFAHSQELWNLTLKPQRSLLESLILKHESWNGHTDSTTWSLRSGLLHAPGKHEQPLSLSWDIEHKVSNLVRHDISQQRGNSQHLQRERDA